MSSGKILLSIWSNNSDFEKYLCEKKHLSDLVFQKYKESSFSDYLCMFLDLEKYQDDLTNDIYQIYLSAKENNQKIAVVLLLHSPETDERQIIFQKLFSEIDTSRLSHRLIVCQDLYTLNESKPITFLDNYVDKVINENFIDVSQKGNFLYYPLSIVDLFDLIKKTLFLSNTNGKEFFAQGDELKDLSLAYLLKNSLLEIFDKEFEINNNVALLGSKSNFQKSCYETKAQVNWDPKEEFETNLSSYLKLKKEKSENLNDYSLSLKNSHKKTIFSKLIHHSKSTINEINPGNLRSKLLKKIEIFVEKLVVFICLVCFICSMVFVGSSFFSLKTLEKTVFYFKKGNLVESVSSLNKFNFYKEISEANYSLISPFLKIFFPKLDATNQNFLNFLNFSQSTATNLQQTYSMAETIYESINRQDSPENYTNLTLALKSNLQQIYESISQLEIILNQSNLPKPLIQKVKQNLEYKQLSAVQGEIGEVIKIIDFLPLFLGDKQNNNIFVLIQNVSEQRATGGAIDFIYQLSFDRGRLIFQKMYQPQEIDLIDTFTLIPPPLVEKLTGQPIWKLRDMNYNPDYPQTATNIAWYLEKKLKIKPDVILALNTSLLEKILQNNQNLSSQISQISVDEYKIKQQNGTSGDATKEIITNIVSLILKHQISMQDVLKLASESLKSNDFLLWSSHSDVEKNILSQNFSGSVRKYDCHPAMSSSRLCLPQTSHLNFSNFSLIPLNGYLQKTTTHTITPLVLSVDHQINVNYIYQKNTPLINRNLMEIVQFFIPKNSIVTELKINDGILPLSTLTAQEEATLTRYQFVLSTDLNKNQTLQIKYSVPLSERTLLPVAYSITDIKQPGQNEGDSSLIINIPEQSRPSAITSEVTSQPDKITYLQGIKTSTFGVNFVPKQP